MDDYDITGKIGPLFPCSAEPEWPMYSFNRPSYNIWNTIAARLHNSGWTDAQIRTWLQSKEARWALDGSLGDLLHKAADEWAQENEPRLCRNHR